MNRVSARALLGVSLSLAVAGLVSAPSAQAGWTGLGGAVNAADGQSQRMTSVAGVPWIVWSEDPGSGLRVNAARWTGSAWVPTGPIDPGAGHQAAGATIADVGGVPYVSWLDIQGGTIHVRVSRWSGSAWVAVGGALDAQRGAFAAITSVAGVPYVAFGDFTAAAEGVALWVKRWTGTAWSTVGTELQTIAIGVTLRDLSIADVGGAAHVAWSEESAANGRQAFVARYDGAAWSRLGGPLGPAGGRLAKSPSLAALDGQPGVAYIVVDSFGGHVRVARWDGTAWVDLSGTLGAATFPQEREVLPSLTEIAGSPWLAWDEDSKIRVSSYDGTTWTGVGSGLVRGAGGEPVAPTIAGVAGVPHVSWMESDGVGHNVYAARLQDDAGTAHLHFSSATYSAPEGSTLTVTVQRGGGTTAPVRVRYETVPGTAGPTDFTGASGRLDFAAGETVKTFTVPTVDDDKRDPDETFTVQLTDPTGDATLDSPASAIVTIADNDGEIDTTISSGPNGYLTDLRFRFFVFEADPAAGATFECALDGAAFAACTNPFDPGTPSEGQHTFAVRGKTAGGAVDPTPATRSFFVDTIRPEAAASVQGDKLPGGKYTGTVSVAGTGTDAGSGVKEVRCAVDPATVPQTAGELKDACPLSTAAAGGHTAYVAAIDKAGNAGIPVKVTFTIVLVPDTRITAGPAGLVSSFPVSVSFTADPVGGTFECALDAGPYASCSSPRQLTELSDGEHTFFVRAVSADGVTDPTPSRRTFEVGTKTVTRSCSGAVPFGDGLNLNGPFSLGGVNCTALDAECPNGSKCTLSLVAGVGDHDIATPWQDFGTLTLGQTGATVTCYSTPEEQHESIKNFFPNDPLPRACSQTRSVSALGPGPARANCDVGRSVYGSGYHQRGPDDLRRHTCVATLTIQPAAPLTVVGGGIVVPGAGVLTISGTVPGNRRVTVAAARPPFKRIRRTVAAAGTVRIAFKLRKDRKRAFRRGKPVKLRLKVAFAPSTGGDPVTRSQRLTLRRPARPYKPPRLKGGKRCKLLLKGCRRARSVGQKKRPGVTPDAKGVALRRGSAQ